MKLLTPKFDYSKALEERKPFFNCFSHNNYVFWRFILRSNDKVKEDLTEKVKNSKEKASQLENTKKNLERNLQESEHALRELIQQKRNKEG